MENTDKTVGEKTCSICKTNKPLERFAIRTNKPHKPYRAECKDCTNTRVRKMWRKYRKRIFDYYGWECKCCGETMSEFLSIDHINNDGYLDKNPNGDKKSGKELYSLIIKEGFSDRFQTLCMNCNWGKKIGKGVCPHNK